MANNIIYTQYWLLHRNKNHWNLVILAHFLLKEHCRIRLHVTPKNRDTTLTIYNYIKYLLHTVDCKYFFCFLRRFFVLENGILDAGAAIPQSCQLLLLPIVNRIASLYSFWYAPIFMVSFKLYPIDRQSDSS